MIPTMFNSPKWQQLIVDVYGYKICQLPESIRRITPAFQVDSLIFGKKITNMPFNFYPKVLSTSQAHTDEMLQFFMDYSKTHDNINIELKFQNPLSENIRATTAWSLHQPFIRSFLKLYNDLEVTYNQAGRNLKKNLNRIRNKMVHQNIEISLAISMQDILEFYNLLVQIYRDRHQMVCHPQKLYEQLYQQNLANFYIAKNDKKIIAGIVILCGIKKHYYAWGATHPDYLQSGTAMALLDKAIQEAINTEAKEFDFGTSPPSDHNLLEFKRRWGCNSVPTFYYNYPPKSNTDIPDFYTSYPVLRQLYKFIPLSVIKHLLPIVVPHLG